MERLTARDKNGNAYYPYCFKAETCDGMGASDKCNNCEFSFWKSNKLADYEDKEEQGLLFEFPCKLGDEIWGLFYWEDTEKWELSKYVFDGIEREGLRLSFHPGEIDIYSFDSIGKTVFTDEEKAKAALLRLEGGKTDEQKENKVGTEIDTSQHEKRPSVVGDQDNIHISPQTSEMDAADSSVEHDDVGRSGTSQKEITGSIG